MKSILNLMREAKTQTVVNPANPAERIEEMVTVKYLPGVLNFEGVVAGWNVKVTTGIKPGGHGETVLNGWRWA